jgi:hypothetical protein
MLSARQNEMPRWAKSRHASLSDGQNRLGIKYGNISSGSSSTGVPDRLRILQHQLQVEHRLVAKPQRAVAHHQPRVMVVEAGRDRLGLKLGLDDPSFVDLRMRPNLRDRDIENERGNVIDLVSEIASNCHSHEHSCGSKYGPGPAATPATRKGSAAPGPR